VYYKRKGHYHWIGSLKDIYELSEILSATIQQLYQEYIVKFPSKELDKKQKQSTKMVVEQISFAGDINIGNIRVIDYAFTRKPIYKVLQDLLYGPALFSDPGVIGQIRVNLNKLNRELSSHTLYAERLLLAIQSICFHFTSTNEVNLDLVISRIAAIRCMKTIAFRVAKKPAAEFVFKEKLLSYEHAKKKYPSVLGGRCDLVLAGGDATRYLKLLQAIMKIPDANELISDEILAKLAIDEKYHDIGHTLNLATIAKLIQTPVFKNIGITLENASRVTKNEQIKLKSLKIIVESVLKKFNRDIIPKALNYAFAFTVKQTDIYLSFFMSTLLRLYSDIIRENTSQNYIYYMVKDKKIAEVLMEIISSLQAQGILKKDLLDVRFLTNIEGSLPLSYEKNYLVFDKKNHLKTTSTGHGPAFIKASEIIFNDLSEVNQDTTAFTVRTIDNSGTHISSYSALIQNSAITESGLRDSIVELIRKNDIHGLFNLMGCSLQESQTSHNIIVQMCQYIDKRWDYRIDSALISSPAEIALKIKDLPLTVAIVIADYQSVGGGLHVNESGQMAIVDKYQCSKEQQCFSKFNPMLFSTLIKKPYNKEMDTKLIFISKKNKKEVLSIQGESAATHIATDPNHVLKRIIELPKSQQARAFAEQKTIDQSHGDNNKELTKELYRDLLLLAKKSGIMVDDMVIILNRLQEKAIEDLHKSDQVGEINKQLLTDKINDFFIPYGQIERLQYKHQSN